MKNLFSLFFFWSNSIFWSSIYKCRNRFKDNSYFVRDEPLGLQKTGDLDDEEDENFELRNMMNRVLSVS